MSFEPLTPERRRAMTRRYLLDAAAIVFARDGFHGATLDEVAKTAGFTKGAVYSNFKSKDDLFLELHQDWAERELAVLTDFLESGANDNYATALPRVRELLRSAMFSWNDTWNALNLEFVLYARRNPEAQAKLAAIQRQWVDWVTQLIERDYKGVRASSRYPSRDMAEISLALFNGLATHRLIDTDLVTEETLDTVLTMLYDTMGVDPAEDPTDPATDDASKTR